MKQFDVTIRIEVYEDGLDMLLSYWDGPVPDRMASEISLVATDTLQLLSNARNADIRVTDVVSKLSTQSYERGLLPITTVMTMPTGRDLYKSDGNPGPSTPIEVSAVDIGVMKLFVAGVLSLRPEDVHEDADFFTIGGDSLSGMQLILQAREKGIYITMTDVAEAKSVSDLARSANRGWKQRRLNPWWAGTS